MKPEQPTKPASEGTPPPAPEATSTPLEQDSTATGTSAIPNQPLSTSAIEELHQEFLASEPETPLSNEPVPQPAPQPDSSAPLQSTQGPINDQSTLASEPAPTPNQPAASPVSYSSQNLKSTKSRARKPLLAISGLIALIVLGGAGYVFGMYLPNKPENVWSTSLDRSGKALEKVVDKTADKSTLQSIKKSDVSATVSITSQDLEYTGQVDVKYDSANTNGKLVIKDEKNTPGKELAVEFLSKLEANKTYPDAFLKVNGITALGFDALLPGVATYENKWIAMDSKYLDQILGTQTEGKDQQITADDVAELTRKAAEPTRQYIFSSNEDKAVLQRDSVVGEEEVDGRETIRYKASVNKKHAKDYCKALVEAVFSTNFYKKTLAEGSDVEKDKQSTTESCQKSVDSDFQDGETYDVWVDKKFKLIYKVRLYDNNTKTYLDVGQTYKGGDDFGFFAVYNDPTSKSEVKVEISSNMKTNQTSGSIAAVFGAGESKIEGSMKMTAKPFDGEVKVDTPKDTIPFEEVLGAFGLNPASSTESSNPVDSEVTSDINAIHSKLEEYYALKGHYPGFANMNREEFVINELKIDISAITAPGSTNKFFSSEIPASKIYAYASSDCNAPKTECQSYKLSGILTDNSTYVKNNLQ